jgi:hypothetical protein
MQIDRQELSAHYASLSDEELLELDRAELTEVAQRFYDSELAKRHLTPEDTETPVEPHGRAAPVDAAEGADEDEDGAAVINFDAGTEPDWLEDATCARSYAVLPGGSAADAGDAHDALVAAGIPCHISVKTFDPNDPKQQYYYCVMVPGARNLEAASALAMAIDNPKEEEMWRAHFEVLSDEELRVLKFDAICAWLRDRLARLKRAYDDEVARRKVR